MTVELDSVAGGDPVGYDRLVRLILLYYLDCIMIDYYRCCIVNIRHDFFPYYNSWSSSFLHLILSLGGNDLTVRLRSISIISTARLLLKYAEYTPISYWNTMYPSDYSCSPDHAIQRHRKQCNPANHVMSIWTQDGDDDEEIECAIHSIVDISIDSGVYTT